MTTEQEKIAEEMVGRMKQESGSTDWHKYRDLMAINKHQIVLVVQALKELKIIEEINPGSTAIRLTEVGWHWPGFNEQRRIAHDEKTTQEQIAKLTLKKLKLEQFPAKFWWLLILITAAISILTTWINNRIEDARKTPDIQQSTNITDSTGAKK